MIHDIFPTKIYIKDYEMTDQWTDEVSSIVKTIFVAEEAKGRAFNDIAENSIPLFTPENEKLFPILTELKGYFIDGFTELAASNTTGEALPFSIDREFVQQRISQETGRLPFMRNGDYKSVHNHAGAMAFGIFYLEDVNNAEEGGELQLRDPSFNSNIGFTGHNKYKVDTKRNRLVIAPAHLWHEVTQFNGTERTAVVINLNVYNDVIR